MNADVVTITVSGDVVFLVIVTLVALIAGTWVASAFAHDSKFESGTDALFAIAFVLSAAVAILSAFGLAITAGVS